jgi:hypothetical protein
VRRDKAEEKQLTDDATNAAAIQESTLPAMRNVVNMPRSKIDVTMTHSVRG